MPKIDSYFSRIGMMDQLAARNTFIHRLDPRAKLLTTLAFIVAVVSFGKYEVSALLPFFLYPIALMTFGDIPAMYLLKKVLLAAPFAILVGVFNPLLDREPLLIVGSLDIAGGWVSFLSICIRFSLTVSAALVLLACSGINGVCLALEKLGTPHAFTVQLLFLYRYLFVLLAEGLRLARARASRSFGRYGMGMKVYGHMLGHLLLRSLDRAQRIHSAMSCRGFNGEIKTMKPLRPGLSDVAFVCGWSFLFVVMRFHNVSRLLGSLAVEACS